MESDPPDGASPSRFRHIREIARGGMGRVSEVADDYLDRRVALKEVLVDDARSRARFAREVAITARLEHPSIIPVYDAGVTATGAPFYVMRRVTGRSLDRVIAAAGTLDQRLRLLPHLLAMADAVAHAHGRGIIHRDLKPSNVLVGELGETIVIDWGLAKVIASPSLGEPLGDHGESHLDDGRTQDGAILGTPGFMAPEQVFGEAADARADVYALGACLYHLLAGKAPGDFSAASAPTTVPANVTRRAEPAGKTTPLRDVPTELITIVERAMALEPRDRYEDAGGLGEELRRFLGGQLVASHRYRLTTRVARWVRRRAVLAVALAATVVLAAFGAVSVSRIVRERRRADEAFERERDRADELVEAHAASHLEDNPTLAVATLQQLPAESARWSQVAGVLASARAGGIAVGYPGTAVLHAAVANGRAVTSERGAVRVDDLAARTSRIIATPAGVAQVAWWGPRIVTLQGGALAVDATPLATPAAVEAIATGGDVLATLGVDRAVRVTAHGAWTVVATDATDVVVSPSGRWLAVGHAARAELFHGGERALEVPGAVRWLAFDGDRRVAFATDDAVTELDLAAVPPAVAHTWPLPRGGGGRYVAGTLYAIAPTGWARLDDGSATAAPPIEVMHRRAVLVGPRRIVVWDGAIRYELRAPEDIVALDADPAGPFLLGVGVGHVLAWDLREIVGLATAAPPVSQLLATDADRVVALAVADDTVASYQIAADGGALRLQAGHVPGLGQLQRRDDGSVVFASLDGTALVLDGPSAARAHHGCPDLRVADDGGLYRADTLLVPPSPQLAISADCSRVAAIVAGTLQVTDIATGQAWPVCKVDGSVPIALLDDGRTLVTADPSDRDTPSAIHVWRFEPPADPVAWVHAATNALAPSTITGAMGWRALPE